MWRLSLRTYAGLNCDSDLLALLRVPTIAFESRVDSLQSSLGEAGISISRPAILNFYPRPPLVLMDFFAASKSC